jgi:hypothetical protein
MPTQNSSPTLVRLKTSTLLALILTAATSLLPAADSHVPPPSPKSWQYVIFPETSTPTRASPLFLATWDTSTLGAAAGLGLTIFGLPHDFFQTNRLTAFLHRANGQIVQPTADGKLELNSPAYISTASPDFSDLPAQVSTSFPWGPNALAESWFEVRVGPERYWLELPYGFDRDPTAPIPPAVSAEPSHFIPVKSPTTHDHLVRWREIHYDLGEIQNHWRLSLIQSNGLDAQSQVILYRDDVKIGTATSWQTNSPTVTLQLLPATGPALSGHCFDIHIQDGGMQRCDTFTLPRDDTRNPQREWAQIQIKVDNQTYPILVPSSLYQYNHAHAVEN